MINVYLEATSSKQKSCKTLLTENAVLLVDNDRLRDEKDKLKQSLAELEMKLKLIRELQHN